MNRKLFIRQCSLACLGASIGSLLLEACQSPMVVAKEQENLLFIPMEAFVKNGKEIKAFMTYHEGKKMPVLVVKEQSIRAYRALCTHQGAELQLMGERLYCPAHGSEFALDGKVKQGPAQLPLISLKVSENNKEIIIEL